MNWERARKPEQKAERRESILAAARVLFRELDYDEISLNAIAREAGISKPNVYRYFSSREEIFLAFYQEEQASFVDALIERLGRIRSKDRVAAISRAWVEVAVRHPTWLNLLPQLATSMERHSSVEQLVEFKKQSYERLEFLLAGLQKIHPALDLDQWKRVVQSAYCMMAGLWPLANPGENVIQALASPDVPGNLWQFEELMSQGMAALIRGMQQSDPD